MPGLSTSRSVPEPAATAAIIESSNDAIIGLTVDGIVTSWNPAAERLYGYAAHEIVGFRLQTIVPEEVRPFEHSRLAKVARGAAQHIDDMPRLRRDGKRLVVASSMFPVRGERQQVTGIASIEHDVTERRALEALLLQAKRSETLARLATGVAQEFNNINTAILGLVEFTEQEVPADAPARKDLREIANQATRGAGLSQQLLAFGKRDAVAGSRVDIAESLRLLETLLQRLVGEGIWFTADHDESALTVVASEGEIELLLFELVLQSADALADGGTVTIATHRTVVHDETPAMSRGIPIGEYVVITVRDRGRLPSAADEPSGDDTSAIADISTDLRLALVLSVVHRLGGYVTSIPSSPDGVELSVFLPFAPLTAADLLVAPEDPARRGGTETILLVEDEDAVRAVLARSLRQGGYRVLEARDGEDALDVVEAHQAPIHLVVSDVIMPRLTGAALFERLRGWYPNLRFVLISGYTRGAVAAGQLDGAHTAFLPKPFALARLASTIRTLLDHPTAGDDR